MKTLTVLSIALVLFVAAPVFACGGEKECDKDKDTQAFTVDAQPLCGGDKGDKPAEPAAMGGGCQPKPDPEPQPEPQCGGDKGDKPDEPQLLCGGGKDKDKEIKT
jgi:hypothetical protein